LNGKVKHLEERKNCSRNGTVLKLKLLTGNCDKFGDQSSLKRERNGGKFSLIMRNKVKILKEQVCIVFND
jgi:hypothetical protein